jgi:predicted dienelactone hydrolase
MNLNQKLKKLGFLVLLAVSVNAVGQKSEGVFVYGDALPDAPDLAPRGKYSIGVKTMELVNKNQTDVLKRKDGVDPVYDRTLKVEVWYPSKVGDAQKDLISYDEVMGTYNDPKRPLIPFKFNGRANRDAALLKTDGKFPLIIVSHGYVGSRYIMSYLCENLASKGYVVVAIDHMESTFRDAAGFASTLLNRSKDVLFVLNQIADLGKAGSGSFLSGGVDADQTGLIGYSMGGYGVLNAAGAGYSDGSVKLFGVLAAGSDALKERTGSNPAYRATVDPRIKAVVAFAPWGMERGVWDAESLKGLKVPTFFVAGSQDDISGYEKGIKAIFDGAVSSDRFMLTYMNARHNVAPNPPPAESLAPGLPFDEYYRYAEPSWDQRRLNNINQHFVTAFMGTYLKAQDNSEYLNLAVDSNEKTWKGFKGRSSTGMTLQQVKAVK